MVCPPLTSSTRMLSKTPKGRWAGSRPSEISTHNVVIDHAFVIFDVVEVYLLGPDEDGSMMRPPTGIKGIDHD